MLKISFDRLGINEARQIRDLISRKVTQREEVLVSCLDITEEAQNALLKSFEEPPPGLSVRFVHPRPQALLGTFRSRFVSIESEGESEGKMSVKVSGADFVRMSLGVRMGIARKLSDEGDREAALMLLVGIEGELHRKGVDQNRVGLQSLLDSRRRLISSDIPMRAILEHIFLVV